MLLHDRAPSSADTRSWVCFSRGPTSAVNPKTKGSIGKNLLPKDDGEEDATQATQSSLSLAPDSEPSQAHVSSSPKMPAHTEPTFSDVGNDNEEEEEYIEVEKDMALRLGNGGRIGVLDVRYGE